MSVLFNQFACLFLIASSLTTLQAEDANDTVPLVDKMLERLGGKTAWANIKNTVNGSMQYRAQGPFEVYSVITMDFTKPRFRIDTTATDVNLTRVINGEYSWRISWSGKVEDLPENSYELDMKWYAAHIYRTIHRLASDDPSLTVREKENYLEVFEEDKRIIWFKLASTAEPYAFGFWDDDKGSLSGPWNIDKNGIKHPAWVSSHDGTWRAAVRMLEINVPLHESLFARPGDTQ